MDEEKTKATNKDSFYTITSQSDEEAEDKNESQIKIQPNKMIKCTPSTENPKR